jgi:transcriptional regulator with XRE-family HTH domain
MGRFSHSAEVTQRLKQLGERVRVARIRRGLSIVELADKAGINRNTLNALELGKPGAALTVFLSVLWALGLEKTLDPIADPETDLHGKALEASRQPKRVRKRQSAGDDYDF